MLCIVYETQRTSDKELFKYQSDSKVEIGESSHNLEERDEVEVRESYEIGVSSMKRKGTWRSHKESPGYTKVSADVKRENSLRFSLLLFLFLWLLFMIVRLLSFSIAVNYFGFSLFSSLIKLFCVIGNDELDEISCNTLSILFCICFTFGVKSLTLGKGKDFFLINILSFVILGMSINRGI